ncbi:MAG: glycosyltransferase [Comamonas sp.]
MLFSPPESAVLHGPTSVEPSCDAVAPAARAVPAPSSPRVQLVYFNAGGGHRASALALAAGIRRAGLDWQVEPVNLFERVDARDVFRRWTGMPPEAIYNKRLALGWTAGLAHELRLLQAGIRVTHPFLMKRLRQHWRESRPDLVVSLVPNFNRAMRLSLAAECPRVPYATVMTDLADLPPRFWIEPDLPIDLVCGTPHAVAQARAAGCSPARVHAVSGMLLREDFYAPRLDRAQRAAERRALGLPAHGPVGLVLFGGEGSRQMLAIARQLPDLPLILMCGRNARLAQRLRELPAAGAPRAVVAFASDVPRYMQLADLFIGKPGPGSLSEAVHMGLPCIVAANAATLPQERYNTRWLAEQGLGVTVTGFDAVGHAVADVLARLPALQANTRRIDNRALFEVPRVLAGLLAGATEPVARVMA